MLASIILIPMIFVTQFYHLSQFGYYYSELKMVSKNALQSPRILETANPHKKLKSVSKVSLVITIFCSRRNFTESPLEFWRRLPLAYCHLKTEIFCKTLNKCKIQTLFFFFPFQNNKKLQGKVYSFFFSLSKQQKT